MSTEFKSKYEQLNVLLNANDADLQQLLEQGKLRKLEGNYYYSAEVLEAAVDYYTKNSILGRVLALLQQQHIPINNPVSTELKMELLPDGLVDLLEDNLNSMVTAATIEERLQGFGELLCSLHIFAVTTGWPIVQICQMVLADERSSQEAAEGIPNKKLAEFISSHNERVQLMKAMSKETLQ